MRERRVVPLIALASICWIPFAESARAEPGSMGADSAASVSAERILPRPIEIDFRIRAARSDDPTLSRPDRGASPFETPLWNVDGYTLEEDRSGRSWIAAGASLVGQIVGRFGDYQLVFFDKSNGAQVGGPVALSSLGCAEPEFRSASPSIVYDQRAGRWLIAFDAVEDVFFGVLCVAISNTDDPLSDGWTLYELDEGGLCCANLAVGRDSYFLRYDNGIGLTPDALAIERAPMLDGLPTRTNRLTLPLPSNNIFIPVEPVTMEGSLPPPPDTQGLYVLAFDDEVFGNQSNPDTDSIDIWNFETSWGSTGLRNFRLLAKVPVSDFDLDDFSVEGPEGTSASVSSGWVNLAPKYRNLGNVEILTVTILEDLGPSPSRRTAVRWIEMRRTNGGDWTLYQEGTWAEPSASRVTPSIAIDQAANIALAAQLIGPTTFHGVRYAGRLASDPLGTLSVLDTSLAEGTGVSEPPNRGFRGTAIVVDPVDDCTFYMTGTYDQGTFVSNRIAAARFPTCGFPPLFADGFESGDTSGWSAQIGTTLADGSSAR